MNKLIHKIFLLAFTLLLAGCGFHLRGHTPLPPQLHTVYINSNDPYGAFTKELQQTLQNAGVILVSGSKLAPITLNILSDNYNQQLTSQGSNGQLSTYVLSYTATYQLMDDKGRVIQSPQTVSTSRNFSVNTNQTLGDLSIQSQLQQDMQRDLVYQLLNRLRANNTLRALQQYSTQ